MSIYRIILCLMMALFMPWLLQAQTWEQRRLDTLLPKLQATLDDTTRISLIADISFSYFPINPDEGLRYGNEALLLAQKSKWNKGIYKAYHSLGANYWSKNDFVNAQSFFLKSLQISEQLNDKDEIARAVHTMGTINQSLHNYEKALDFYKRSLAIYKEENDLRSTYGVLANIASIYESQEKYDTALGTYMESLKLARKINDEGDVAWRLGAIGLVYAKAGNYSKALEYEDSSLQIRKRIGVKTDIGNKYFEIGEIYFDKGDFPSAIKYFGMALNTVEGISANSALGCKERALGKTGRAYLNMSGGSDKKLLANAFSNLKAGIPIAQSLNDKVSLAILYQDLSEAYTKLGNDKAALDNYKVYISYRDSVNNLEKDKEIIRSQIAYDYAKEEDSLRYITQLQTNKLTSLSQEKLLNQLKFRQRFLVVVGGIILLGLACAFLIFRNRVQRLNHKNELAREKAEKQLKEAEYQKQINEITFSALRSQMNPHFIFNALNTIQNYVYSNDKKKANIYLGKFSELIRKILDNSNKKLIPLEEEIELLQLYLDIEKARFGNTFHAKINISPDIDAGHISIPPMIIQPYAENAIKHGLIHRPDYKKLVIEISKSENNEELTIIIDDNGTGRNKSYELNKIRLRHVSFANAATQKRIELMNQLYERKTLLNIIDKTNEDGSPAGTRVIIRLPVIFS